MKVSIFIKKKLNFLIKCFLEIYNQHSGGGSKVSFKGQTVVANDRKKNPRKRM